MRLLVAAFVVVLSMFVIAAIFSAFGWLERPNFPAGLMLVASFALSVILAYFLFRPRIPSLAELDRTGLVEAIQFRATRAFGIEDYNDEGPHYFLELEDGRVLYLVGQYLYDYEPIDDDSEVKQPRKFPCAEFVMFRHKTRGDWLNLRCGSLVLEPELMARVKDPFYVLKRLIGHIPEDGEVIYGLDYDTLKEKIQEASR